jgi:hypothetical protein
MDNLQRRTCATEFKMLDGERRIPTEAELDHMLYELVRDKLTYDDHEPEPERTVPTETELRAQARELGIAVLRAREGTAERFRDDMLKLLATVEPVATKSLPLPVQIASFEA